MIFYFLHLHVFQFISIYVFRFLLTPVYPREYRHCPIAFIIISPKSIRTQPTTKHSRLSIKIQKKYKFKWIKWYKSKTFLLKQKQWTGKLNFSMWMLKFINRRCCRRHRIIWSMFSCFAFFFSARLADSASKSRHAMEINVV